MANIKPRVEYQAISLPKEFVKEVREYVLNHDKYRSVAEFTRDAVIEKMDRDYKLKTRIVDGARALSKKQEEKIIESLYQRMNKGKDKKTS